MGEELKSEKDPGAGDSPRPPEGAESGNVTDMEAYNIVADTVTGVNFRVRDNLMQAVTILVAVALGSGIGGIFTAPEYLIGAFIGGAAGLVLGTFASGLFLMIYRAVRHAAGRHD